MSPALRLRLEPAPVLAAGLLAAHAGAAAAAAAAIPGAAGWALAGALVALGAASAWGRALLRFPGSVRQVEIDGEGLVLVLADGRRMAVEPSTRRYVSRHVVALPVRGSLRRTILVTRGMLAPEAFRRLRLWALWGRLPGVAPAQTAA